MTTIIPKAKGEVRYEYEVTRSTWPGGSPEYQVIVYDDRGNEVRRSPVAGLAYRESLIHDVCTHVGAEVERRTGVRPTFVDRAKI